MGNTSPESVPDGATGELAETVANITFNVVEVRDYLGRKVARELMDEMRLSGKLSEQWDGDLEKILGSAAASGMVLSMTEATDSATIEAEAMKLTDGLPERLRVPLGKLTPTLLERGVAFHRDDLSQRTDKCILWINEFKLLKSTNRKNK